MNTHKWHYTLIEIDHNKFEKYEILTWRCAIYQMVVPFWIVAYLKNWIEHDCTFWWIYLKFLWKKNRIVDRIYWAELNFASSFVLYCSGVHATEHSEVFQVTLFAMPYFIWLCLRLHIPLLPRIVYSNSRRVTCNVPSL